MCAAISSLPPLMAPIASVAALKQQLAKLGHADFVIIGPDGTVADAAGSFVDNVAKCRAAYSVVQQASSIMRPGEKLKRVTVTFTEYTFVASVCSIQGRSFGVVVQHQQSAAAQQQPQRAGHAASSVE